MRILVLDGNENQAVAAVRSLSRAGHRVLVGAPTSLSKAGCSRYRGGTFVYPPPQQDAEAFAQRIAAKAAEEPGTFVLPMTERTTLPVSGRRELVLGKGGVLVLPPHEVVLRAFDKAETTALARRLDILVPETCVVSRLEELEPLTGSLKFPLVLKAQRSEDVTPTGAVRAGGRPHYARTPNELRDAFLDIRRRSAGVLVQEFVKGTGEGYFALMRHGQPIAEFAHRRIRDVRPSGSGSALRVSAEPSPALRSAGRAVLGALEWHGVAMVEFRVGPNGELYFLEVNGRFWNSLALAIHAGVDFPALLAEMAQGRTASAAGTYREGVRCRWLLGDVRHLIEVWRGAPPSYPCPYPSRWRTLVEFLTPRRGTYHDNFEWSDPLPELVDWLDFAFRVLPRGRNANG
jgi:predicted ATP-grasp superfamily ATP-dependent carboligase